MFIELLFIKHLFKNDKVNEIHLYVLNYVYIQSQYPIEKLI